MMLRRLLDRLLGEPLPPQRGLDSFDVPPPRPSNAHQIPPDFDD